METQSNERVGDYEGNTPGLIYGVLAVATVIAAESTRRETFAKLLVASAVVMALYWLAHAYSQYLGTRLFHVGDWTLREAATAVVHEAAILEGALLPMLALLGAWIAGASLEVGVTAALWCAGSELVVLEVLASIRRHLGWKATAIETLVGVVMGLGILSVRVLLH